MTISIVDLISDNTLTFCDLALFGACSTGEGGVGANNLVNKTNQKGVKTVIGFTQSVNCSEMNAWATAFFSALSNGNSVINACYAADDIISSQYSNITTNSWYIAGLTKMSF